MSSQDWLIFVIFPLAAYVVGSTPFGYLMGKAKGVDLRKQGSGNVGATNVGRVLGRKWGYTCFLLDVAKGFVPVVLAGNYLRGQGMVGTAGQLAWLGVGMGVIFGHIFTFWLKFRGGKGVAVYIGILIGLFWPGAIFFCLVWLATAFAFRYSSLAALAASVLTPIMLWAFGHSALAVLFSVLTLLLIYMHRENIRRLQAGTESKIGAKK